MKITDFQVYHYAIPLSCPLFVRGTALKQREGFIVQLMSEKEVLGFGEAAPLIGFSKETKGEVFAQLKTLKSVIVGETIPTNAISLEGALTKWLKKFKLSSSVIFALESAVLYLMSNTKGVALNNLLSNNSHEQIRINGLLQGKTKDLVIQVKSMLKEGFNAFKLKVGTAADLEEDIEKVQAVSQEIEGKAILHIDANQSWTLEQGIHFGKKVGLATIDYIEEPLRNILDITEFFMETMLPVALDETIQTLNFDQIKSIEGVDVLILKPTCIGGVEKTWGLMELAKSAAIKTVISSSFESGIGLMTLAQLSGCSKRDNHAGLDTLKWLEYDLLKEHLCIEHGKLNIAARTCLAKDIDFSRLTKVL